MTALLREPFENERSSHTTLLSSKNGKPQGAFIYSHVTILPLKFYPSITDVTAVRLDMSLKERQFLQRNLKIQIRLKLQITDVLLEIAMI